MPDEQVPPADEPAPATSHESTGLDLARRLADAVRRTAKRRRSTKDERRRGSGAVEYSGAHADARDPAQLGALVEQVVGDRGWNRQVADHAVYAKWGHIVGPEVAAHCSPEAFADRLLSIRTDSTAWATQLRLLAPNVVARLNEVLGDGSVARIEVRGPEAPSWRHGRRAVRGARGPGDTYG